MPKNNPGIALTRGEYPFNKKRAYINFSDLNETLLWIYGHEIFHYLCDNKQISGKNAEERADAYADQLLKNYKNKVAKVFT